MISVEPNDEIGESGQQPRNMRKKMTMGELGGAHKMALELKPKHGSDRDLGDSDMTNLAKNAARDWRKKLVEEMVEGGDPISSDLGEESGK